MSIVQLPKGIGKDINNESKITFSQESLTNLGRSEFSTFIEFNFCVTDKSINASLNAKLPGLSTIMTEPFEPLVEIAKSILAHTDVAKYLSQPLIKWYQELCCLIGKDTKGIFRPARQIPTEIYLANNMIIDDITQLSIPKHKQIIRNDSGLILVESTKNWELLPQDYFHGQKHSKGYYLGTKSNDGRALEGIFLSLPKYEEYEIRRGEIHI